MNLTTGNLFIDTGFCQCCHFQENVFIHLANDIYLHTND